MFGRGWSFNYDQEVRSPLCKAEGFISVTGAAGGATLYATSASVCNQGGAHSVTLTPSDPPSAKDKLTYSCDGSASSGRFELETRADWRKYRFDPASVPESGTLSTWLLSAIADPDGNTVTITRNPDSTIASTTDAAGRTTTFTYDSTTKLCTAITLPNNKSITFAYDTSNNLIESVDLEGNRIIYTYDTDGYMTSMRLGTRTTNFGWDSGINPKKIISVNDPLGNTQTYTRAGSGITDAKDGEGNTSRYTANKEGQTTEAKDPLSNKYSYSFSGGLLESLTNPDFSNIAWTYNNSTGDVLTEKNTQSGLTIMAYDAATGDLTDVTTPNLNTWSLTYDVKHHLTSVTSPLNRKTEYFYDATIGKLTKISAAGNDTLLHYDGHGNLTRITDPEGAVTSRLFDTNGLLPILVTDPWNNTSQLEFDQNRRLTKIIHPDGSYRQFTYDCCRLTAIRDENGHTTTLTWDKAQRLTEITDPLGKKVSIGYNRAHALINARRPDRQTINIIPDALGRPSSIITPVGETVGLTYNAAGQLASLTNQKNNTTTFQYEAGLPWMISDPLGNNTIYSWDKELRLKSKLNARFNGLDIFYSKDGDITDIKPWGSSQSIASYVYDSATGWLEGITDASGISGIAYDKAGRVIGITHPNTKSLLLTRTSGRVTGFTYPGDNTTDSLNVTYAYDNRNRLASMSWDSRIVSFTYDPVGNRTGLVRNRIVGYDNDNNPILLPITSSAYEYDAVNRTSRVIHRHHVVNQGMTVFADLQYVRDSMGNVLRETSLRPLASTLNTGIKDYAYDAADRLASYTGNSVTHDADGNLTAIAGTDAESIVYDEFNRITSVTKGGITTIYIYDGLGNRVKRDAGGVVTIWYYDHTGRLRYETDGTGTITARWFWAGSRLFAVWLKNIGYRWYHFDKQGSVVALTDDNGTITDSFAYMPYGQQAVRTGSTPALFTWIGEHGVVDDTNGVYFMKNRYYDSSLGRFLQKDPIGVAGGINLYEYAGNNPANYIDPKGLESDEELESSDEELESDEEENLSFDGRELIPMPLRGTAEELYLIRERAEEENWSRMRMGTYERAWNDAYMRVVNPALSATERALLERGRYRHCWEQMDDYGDSRNRATYAQELMRSRHVHDDNGIIIYLTGIKLALFPLFGGSEELDRDHPY